VPGQPTGRWSGCCTNISQGKAPYQDWAKAIFAVRDVDQFEPHTRCHASGASRQFSTPYGTELLEMPDLKRIYIMDEGGPHSYRIIYMDGREHPKNLVPSNYGHSVGHFEGDTLVVDSAGFDDRTWLDQYGDPFSADMKVQERWRRVGDTLEFNITVTDPNTYTKPWVSDKIIWKLVPDADLREEVCAPIDEQFFNQNLRNPAGGVSAN